MSIHLKDWGGTGAPLLLTHGMAANVHWWDTTAPTLLPRLHPVAMDFSGHGDSVWAPDGVYDAPRFVEDIETARRKLGWEKMILCGHSMGARVALEYARRHPRRLLGLIAVDFLPEFYQSKARRFEKTRTRSQPVYTDLVRMIDKFHLQPAGTLLTGEELKDFAQHCIRHGKEGGYTWKFDWRAFLFPYEPIWETLAQVDVPSLIVRGEHSTVITKTDFDRVVAAIPVATGLEIARAHHHVPLDTPLELAQAIAAFALTLGA
ncbi:MAG: alpha/beta hydrolase [Elusimicrobiota bacterium]